MEARDLLSGRIRELSQKAWQNGYVTHTDFLSVSEQADIYALLPSLGASGLSTRLNGSEFVFCGGFEEAERAVLFFLPDYLDRESFSTSPDMQEEYLACIRIEPVNRKFSDELTHRDFLGALMNLGIERDQIGDIISDHTEAYVFVIRNKAELICRELTRVRHTTVMGKAVPLSACTLRPAFEEREGSVASERLDCILAFVYKLSRGEAQELISSENVIVDGRTAGSAGTILKNGARVSVRGKGKFIYEGMRNTTRKGRSCIRVRVYA